MDVPQPTLRPHDVAFAYWLLLGREPESREVINHHIEGAGTLENLVRNIVNSAEFRQLHRFSGPGLTPRPSPYWHFNSPLDIEAIVRSHAREGVHGRPGCLVNYLGVAIPVKVMPRLLGERNGQVDPVPVPANFHADMAEFGAALHAVDLARDRFTMMELGCGWGCWMLNTGMAAKARGLAVDLVGIEADALHLDWARETFALNGFQPGEYELIRGIAAAHEGHALFPKRPGDEQLWWDGEPRFGASEREMREAVASGEWEAMRMVALEQALGRRPKLDLLHIDIQGGEVDVVSGALDFLRRKVAYMVIGTHSRQIEGRLLDVLLGAGWMLEVERPALLEIREGRPVVAVDGVQGWRNPALLP